MKELDLILKQKRENDKNWRYFLAAIQGVDLEKSERNEVQERLDKVRQRAEARLAGGEQALEAKQLTAIGFRVKTV